MTFSVFYLFLIPNTCIYVLMWHFCPPVIYTVLINVFSTSRRFMFPVLRLPPNAALTLDTDVPHAAVRHVAHGWKAAARCRWWTRCSEPCSWCPQPWSCVVPVCGTLSPSRAGFFRPGRTGYRAGRGALRLGHAGFCVAAPSSRLDVTNVLFFY
jgi:hypothetical protein